MGGDIKRSLNALETLKGRVSKTAGVIREGKTCDNDGDLFYKRHYSTLLRGDTKRKYDVV